MKITINNVLILVKIHYVDEEVEKIRKVYYFLIIFFHMKKQIFFKVVS